MQLLDTHIWVWWLTRTKGKLSPAKLRKLDQLSDQEELAVSAISLWEVANLHSLGRINFSIPLRDWLKKASDVRVVHVEPISPEIAAEVAALPDWLHRDPADRLIIATARTLGIPLTTHDKKIVQSELVQTLS